MSCCYIQGRHRAGPLTRYGRATGLYGQMLDDEEMDVIVTLAYHRRWQVLARKGMRFSGAFWESTFNMLDAPVRRRPDETRFR